MYLLVRGHTERGSDMQIEISRDEVLPTIRNNIKLPQEVFWVWFVKKDGSVRAMSCSLHVFKHLKGGEKSWKDEDFPHLLTVFDTKTKGYRTVNLNTVFKLSVHHNTYIVR